MLDCMNHEIGTMFFKSLALCTVPDSYIESISIYWSDLRAEIQRNGKPINLHASYQLPQQAYNHCYKVWEAHNELQSQKQGELWEVNRTVNYVSVKNTTVKYSWWPECSQMLPARTEDCSWISLSWEKSCCKVFFECHLNWK